MYSSCPAAPVMRLQCGPPARQRQIISVLLRYPRKSGTHAELVR